MVALEKHKGQSLVEMCLVVPLLAFIFIGLIEVGWVIVVYLNLLQWSREAARFGVRENVMDYRAEDPYALVKDHFDEISRDSVVTRFSIDGSKPTASVVMQRIDVWTGVTCSEEPCSAVCEALPEDLLFTDDDQITTYFDRADYKKQYGLEEASHLDTLAIAETMRQESNKLNCQREKRGSSFYGMADEAFIVEINYKSPQLINFPILDWLGSVPLHVSTKMRYGHGGERP